MSYSMSAEEVIVKKIDRSCYKRNNSLQLSVRIYCHNESLNESRSRYARCVHYELVGRKHRVVPRDREPSRVPFNDSPIFCTKAEIYEKWFVL